MAKRKNPLKDLDDFLKQESTSFVNPDEIKPRKAEPKDESITSEPSSSEAGQQISKENIIESLQWLAHKEGDTFRNTLYEIITQTLESLDKHAAEDKMLINTLLYIQDKENWKENIKNYWQKS